ncbi:hypothetical protein NDU88_002522 [Pleurodeles waltl]|uniref:Uncharacterized protein n=1 Tax=Pleurodeles waltl TaxID=8319 RepID=A0AAV7VEP0_PLEWA|nr:hypothetical protein NDU88_002522 [Pleurodeles waltl]
MCRTRVLAVRCQLERGPRWLLRARYQGEDWLRAPERPLSAGSLVLKAALSPRPRRPTSLLPPYSVDPSPWRRDVTRPATVFLTR